MNRTQKTFMPIWQPFTDIPAEAMIGSLSDVEERTVALAAHHYFQAKYKDAARESQRFLNSPCPEIRASALLLHSMANVGLGNAKLVRADFAALTQAARQPEDEKMAAIFDALRYLLAVFFHTDGVIEPVREEHTALLPEGTRLYLLYAVAHALYLQKRYQEALGVARSALMMAAGRFPSVCVYLNLVGSTTQVWRRSFSTGPGRSPGRKITFSPLWSTMGCCRGRLKSTSGTLSRSSTAGLRKRSWPSPGAG